MLVLVVCFALVANAQPAFAGQVPHGPAGLVIPIGGGSGRPGCTTEGLASGVIGGPDSRTLPFTTTVGMTAPELPVEPIEVDAMIPPGEGESFEPIHLVEVRARPTVKVLRNGTIDTGQAVMVWTFTVEQRCTVTNQLVRCRYTYHEMHDGSVFEVVNLPDGGGLQERRFAILCEGGHPAFGAPGAPVDLGVRLLAAAEAEVEPAEIEAEFAQAVETYLPAAAGVPELHLTEEVAAWGNLIAAAIGLTASFFGAPCGVFIIGVIGAEASAWLSLAATAAARSEQARIVNAAAAITWKVTATVALVQMDLVCATTTFTPAQALLVAAMTTLALTVWCLSISAYIQVMGILAIFAIWG